MFGFGFDGGGDRLAGVVPPVLRDATNALLARMTAAPDVARAALIDRTIGALVDGGVWAKLDVLVVTAAHHPQAALLNWKGAGASASLIGAPVFVADRGMFTDGSDDAIDWGWQPANGVAFQQNSGMFGAWFRREDRNAASPLGTQTATNCTLNPRSSSDVAAGRINSATVSSGGTATSGAGLVAIDRSGANAVQLYRDGNAIGTTSTAASAARPAVAMGCGKAGSAFAENQFAAHFAGASLSAGEHRVLADALTAYMTAVGVTRLIPSARTLALQSAITLPDGARPVVAGRGMAATGLARDGVDGAWWVGTGLASPQPTTGVARVSPDLSTVLVEYTVAGWGLGSEYNGSTQGVAYDASDATVWLVLKATSSGAYLLHIGRDGSLLGAPVALPASANGIAVDPVRGQLAILFDASPASVRWYSKSGVDLSASTQILSLPSNFGDHLTFDAANGDLFASWGDNGSDGIVGRYSRASYGGFALAETMTLTGADAIEGIVLDGGMLHVVNDAATHGGSPPANRVLRYAC